MKNRTDKAPFWLRDPGLPPCPRWCAGDHHDCDGGANRAHVSGWQKRIILTAMDAVCREYRTIGVTVEPVAVEIQLRQDPRGVAPLVQLYIAEESYGCQADLTVTEAGKVAEALLHAVTLAGQQARP
jgi:hypothetical protein